MKQLSNEKPFPILTLIAAILFSLVACEKNDIPKPSSLTPDADNGTLRLAEGFGAITVANETGKARHLAVHENGDVYVKLNSLKDGRGIVLLRDTDKDGRADMQEAFGNFPGTGIAIKDGYLYASSDDEVFRYRFNSSKNIENADSPEKIITGLLKGNQHSSKSITLDNKQNIYVNIGAPSNSCQVQDRVPGSLGQLPCPLLENSCGIWQFNVNQLNQTQSQGSRFATGLRNIVGLDWNHKENDLYVMQHGRDQLAFLFPQLYTNEMSAELPAEEFLRVRKGMDFGWPYCYYDHMQNKKVLAPEYGGDGKKEGDCGTKEKPILAFPGHWAPNALLFYTGKQFPPKYKNGAFIAFHGSWNRAPLRQGGYFVVFVPMSNGLPSGNWKCLRKDLQELMCSPRQTRQDTGRWDWPRARTDHYIFPTLRLDGFGELFTKGNA